MLCRSNSLYAFTNEYNKEPSIDLKQKDAVKVISGPFEKFMGTVDSINLEKKKVKVYVSMFGRETLLELDFDQVEKL